MSYTIHITRKNHWTDDDPKITKDEWVKLVANDPEFEPQASDKARDDYLCAWKNPQGKAWPFYISRGDVDIDHGDLEVVPKAKEVAKKLQAKVQGDDGELY